MTKAIPVFYDCEASSLEGVPIEIGWAYAADAGDIVSGSCLVRPAPSWRIEEMWDPEAEALHGISLSQLLAEGMASSDIARSLNRAFAGREFFADDPHDEAWLMRVFDEARIHPAFQILRTDARVLLAEFAAERGVPLAAFEDIKRQANDGVAVRHRAKPDARRYALMWLAIASYNPPT